MKNNRLKPELLDIVYFIVFLAAIYSVAVLLSLYLFGL